MITPIPDRIQVKVRLGAGAYLTSDKGRTSSCSEGPERAVKNLANKVYGPGNHGVSMLREYAPGVKLWEIVKAGAA